MKKFWIGIGLVVLAIAWYAFRPELLFINNSVAESFPVASVAATTPDAGSDPKQLAMGQFKGYAHETQGNADVYEVNGKRVLRLTNFKTSNGPDVHGKRVLRLTDFKTSNGPDVHVYLIAAPDAKDDATVKKAGFVDLGSMKGNTGDQNYDVPVSVDFAKYQAVTIWCARFNVNFGTAPLMASN